MNAKLKTDALDLTSLLNGLVFFSPVSLLVRTTAGISLSQFFILQAIMATMVLLTEIPLGKLTDRIGYKSTLVLCTPGVPSYCVPRSAAFQCDLSADDLRRRCEGRSRHHRTRHGRYADEHLKADRAKTVH